MSDLATNSKIQTRQTKSLSALLTLLIIGIGILLIVGATSAAALQSFNDRSLQLYKNATYGFSFLNPRSAPLTINEEATPVGTEVRFYEDIKESDKQFNSVGRDEAVGIKSISGSFYSYKNLKYQYDNKDDYFDGFRSYYDGTMNTREVKEISYISVSGKPAMKVLTESKGKYTDYVLRNTEIYVYGDNYTFELSIIDTSGSKVDGDVQRVIESVKLP